MSAYLNLQHDLIAVASARTVGTVKSIVGLTLTVAGLGAVARIGSRCRVRGKQDVVEGEVVGAEGSDLCLLPDGSWDGFAVGDPVELLEQDDMVFPDESWIGSVVDALGRPLSGYRRARRPRQKSLYRAHPPGAFDRKQVGDKLETKIKCVDIFTPICQF